MCRQPGSLAALAVLVWSGCVSKTFADSSLNTAIAEAFEFADKQLTFLAEDVLVTNDVFTDYTDEDGIWSADRDLTVWTSGMVAGMFWYQYEQTGSQAMKEFAEYWTAGLEGVELLDDNDIGFQVFNSFGLGYRLTGESSYMDTVLAGADTLHDLRYDENIPAFWSWSEPSRRPEWERAVNVDMMMNMEIMLWAAENGGDPDFVGEAIGHADTTWKDIVRDDNSTFHVADYDPDTGELVDQGTYQGYSDDSTWSRGQAWAVHGFVMLYRYTQEPRFIDYAVGLLEYFVDNLPEDNVPYSDFDAPLDDENLKDSSSTAIVASALLEMFVTIGEPYYLELAEEFLTSVLSSPYFEPDADDSWQALLRGVTSEHGSPETGSVFADYYLLETMVRYSRMAPCTLVREEGSVTLNETSSDDDDDDSDSDSDSDDDSDDRRRSLRANERKLNDVSVVDNDVSSLRDDEPVFIWLGVTLSMADVYPSIIQFTGEDGRVFATTVEAPEGGWREGQSKTHFSVSAGSFSSFSSVTSISVQTSGSSDGSAVTVDWVVLTHDLGL